MDRIVYLHVLRQEVVTHSVKISEVWVEEKPPTADLHLQSGQNLLHSLLFCLALQVIQSLQCVVYIYVGLMPTQLVMICSLSRSL